MEELFAKAVSDSKTFPQKPGNDDLLKLYALYKQSTQGDVNTEPPANPLDFVNKAKYEAWSELKGKTKEAAMQQYVELVTKLKT